MVALRNNFEGGPDGTTITVGNSNQAGTQNPFDLVTLSGTGAVLQYTNVAANNLNRPTAEYVMQMSSGSSTGNMYCRYTAGLGSAHEVWMRFYVFFSSISTNATDLNLCQLRGAGVQQVGVWLRTSTTPYCLQINNNFHVVTTNMTSTPIVAGVWHRVEFHVLSGGSGSGTTGSSNLFLYADPDSDSNTYTDTISQTSQDYWQNTADGFTLGQDYNARANTAATYLSNWEINTTGYPGPAPFRAGLGSPSGNLANPVAIHSDIS